MDQYIRDNLKDEKKIKSYIRDTYYDNKKLLNTMLIMYDLDIPQDMDSHIEGEDRINRYSYVKKICDEYAIEKDTVLLAINEWLRMLGKDFSSDYYYIVTNDKVERIPVEKCGYLRLWRDYTVGLFLSNNFDIMPMIEFDYSLIDWIDEALNSISENDAIIVKYIYGLNGFPCYSEEELQDMYKFNSDGSKFSSSYYFWIINEALESIDYKCPCKKDKILNNDFGVPNYYINYIEDEICKALALGYHMTDDGMVSLCDKDEDIHKIIKDININLTRRFVALLDKEIAEEVKSLDLDYVTKQYFNQLENKDIQTFTDMLNSFYEVRQLFKWSSTAAEQRFFMAINELSKGSEADKGFVREVRVTSGKDSVWYKYCFTGIYTIVTEIAKDIYDKLRESQIPLGDLCMTRNEKLIYYMAKNDIVYVDDVALKLPLFKNSQSNEELNDFTDEIDEFFKKRSILFRNEKKLFDDQSISLEGFLDKYIKEIENDHIQNRLLCYIKLNSL